MLRPPVDSGCLARTASEIAPGIIMITKRAANPQFTKESEPQYDGHHNHHRDDNRQQCSTWVGFWPKRCWLRVLLLNWPRRLWLLCHQP